MRSFVSITPVRQFSFFPLLWSITGSVIQCNLYYLNTKLISDSHDSDKHEPAESANTTRKSSDTLGTAVKRVLPCLSGFFCLVWFGFLFFWKYYYCCCHYHQHNHLICLHFSSSAWELELTRVWITKVFNYTVMGRLYFYWRVGSTLPHLPLQ